VGIAALAAGFQGWLLQRTNTLERAMLITAGVALVYPVHTADVIGFGLVAAALALQFLRGRWRPGSSR
jgi:TRAP-type uncharacterized transport system fused permease subunit